MYVSMDFEVDGDITPEEAITAVRRYCSELQPSHAHTIKIHRGPNSIEVEVQMTLVRAGHTPLQGEPA